MNFWIADSFSDSLARLTGEEQKAAKLTAIDLQLNPTSPGLQFHKLDKAKDKNFCSVRVNKDIRLILHKTAGDLLLCYVNHHDKAYKWAEKRKLETHPTTGAAQMVEIRERVQEIVIPSYVEEKKPKPAARKQPFLAMSDEELLSYGVPLEWLKDVRVSDDMTILELSEHLPAEAAEALLEIATGGKPRVPTPVAKAEGFEHPDALRRFRLMGNAQELQQALEYPWEKWTIFLHPDQRQWVEKDYNGPARVSGSAGTGKTIVALHRAAFLAKSHPKARVLLTTFSDTLAHALQTKLNRLVASDSKVAERITVLSLNAIASRLYEEEIGPVKLTTPDQVREAIQKASASVPGHKFTPHFLFSEWEHIVDAWQLDSWESYRDVARLGRKTRLPEPQRKLLWSIFEKVRDGSKQRKVITRAAMFTTLAQAIGKSSKPKFDHVIVDEAQDISVCHVRFFAALGQNRPNALFFAGDLGQRIFQMPFSWKALGVDVRGRSRTLKVNYRTSHQIRMQADRLLGTEMTDIDGNKEDRRR